MTKSFTILGDPKTSPWTKGIATSPIAGLGNVRNIDIQTNPGSIRLNNLTEKKTGSLVTGNVWSMSQDPATGYIFAITDTHLVLRSTDSGSTWTVIGDGTGAAGTAKTNNTATTGGGCEVWKGYLFVIGATTGSTGNVDVYGPVLSPGATPWTNQWQTIDTSYSQITLPMFVSIDGNLYIGNGKYVSKLQENAAPFAPATAGSYTWTVKAITLADNYIISAIQDLGSNLMLGTQFLSPSLQPKADIFPYDRTNLTLGLPIQLRTNGVRAMKTYGNRLYIIAGLTGTLYVTDSVTSQVVIKLPNYLINTDGATQIFTYFSGMAVYRDKILFGISSGSINSGVWSWDLINKALVFENLISTGDDSAIILSLLVVAPNQYLIGWQNNVYGIDKVNNLLRYTGYLGYVESALVKIGEVLENRTIGNLEINLTKPLVSGQGVKIKWRSNLTSNFTTLATFDFTTYGAVQGYNFSAATLTGLLFLQVRIELTSTDNTSPEVQSILLHPD